MTYLELVVSCVAGGLVALGLVAGVGWLLPDLQGRGYTMMYYLGLVASAVVASLVFHYLCELSDLAVQWFYDREADRLKILQVEKQMRGPSRQRLHELRRLGLIDIDQYKAGLVRTVRRDPNL